MAKGNFVKMRNILTNLRLDAKGKLRILKC